MAKSKTEYVCTECGYTSPTWYGRCPSCKAYSTLEEIKIKPEPVQGIARAVGISLPQPLSEISENSEIRFKSGISELDRVLGGGFVKGSVVLVAGEPGIGKSTLLLQACDALCKQGKVLYISGEESKTQIKMRANRLGINTDGLLVNCENSVKTVLESADSIKPLLVIIDSVQTSYSEDAQSGAGSITQVKEATMAYMTYAKATGTTIVIVSHVNKEGNIAGPKTMEHMVDAVLNFEGDRHIAYRMLRAAKNRFGSTNEIGMFEMTSQGLREIENPSAALLEGRPQDASGSCVVASLEGTRPILAEVQGLVTKSVYGSPRRTSSGIDYNRSALILAVLEKRVGLKLSTFDAYINVVGGMDMDEPACDLAAAIAIASSYLEKPVSPTLAVFGEIGLSGEIRAVNGASHRVQEAKRLGFDTIILPKSCMRDIGKDDGAGVKLIPVTDLREAIKAAVS